jgi:hypothetical protein
MRAPPESFKPIIGAPIIGLNILAEDIDEPAVDGTPTGDHAIAWYAPVPHPEVRLTVHDKGIYLPEGSFVEQKIDTFMGRQLAGRLLFLDAFLSATLLRQVSQAS